MQSGKQTTQNHQNRNFSLWKILKWKKRLPFIFITITLIPCILLIWGSLNYSNSSLSSDAVDLLEGFIFPTNRSFYEVVVNTLPPETETATTASAFNHKREVLTLFLQEDTLSFETTPLPKISKLEFPHMGIASCSDRATIVPKLPIDEFPSTDPYLPWIHDYHINFPSATDVHFIAQNKRRCYTGIGMESNMKHWEPQIALFQPISIRQNVAIDKRIQYHLTSMENATYRETRFLCHFHSAPSRTGDGTVINATTLSSYFFNYEYVVWRKGNNYLPMYKLTGRDVSNFVLSQLLFKCPIPSDARSALFLQKANSSSDVPQIYLDVIPIRTRLRHTNLPMVTTDMVGPDFYKSLQQDKEWLNVTKAYNTNNVRIIPELNHSGRYANLPLCSAANVYSGVESQSIMHNSSTEVKPYHLVACTWTSASYNRRGDKTVIDDASSRLLEWILFHRLAGIDHIYLYDNTQIAPGENETSPLYKICQQFPEYVTYISWPASICNNNRPNHKNPGERSSQYAAEASCRSRFGDTTEWMTFLDTDEYLVPMMKHERQQDVTTNRGSIHNEMTTWHEVLKVMEGKGYYILKMPSSRGRPRVNLMEMYTGGNSDCGDSRRVTLKPDQLNNHNDSCLVPRRNETYLRVYNCDYIRHPRPDRFLRAMKQIYRPAYVLSHFVHYSASTVDMAKYYVDYSNENQRSYSVEIKHDSIREHSLDELSEGALIHTKTVLPHETSTRARSCFTQSKHVCMMGYACHNTTLFDDATHTKNLFLDLYGNFCNCWVDEDIDKYWIPLLENALEDYL